MNSELIPKNHFHFIGVGGIGMSALAMGLLKKGCSVSGSDVIKNNETNKLEHLGAIIFTSQIKQFVGKFWNNKFNILSNLRSKD